MNNIKTMKIQKLYLMLLTIMIVNACSIEKKHASFGYHIEWRNNKFSEGNKPIAQITKPKVAVINETDLILETKANAVEPNQDLNTEIVSASNEKSKYNLINKTRNINSKQLSIIKKTYEFVNKKKPLPKQSSGNGLKSMGFLFLSLLFSFLSIFSHSYLFSYFLLFLACLCIVMSLIYLIPLYLKRFKSIVYFFRGIFNWPTKKNDENESNLLKKK